MSHQPRGEPVPIYRDGEYTAGERGETIVPIQGATNTSSRLRRSASAEHNPDSLAEKPPSGSARPPAFVHDDKFFNEKITLPRLAVNEREHITAEDYDNEDRGSLDNEEQSYDRQVRYSQSRSGSLPPRRFQEQRSSYFDWSGTAPRGQYYESKTQALEGGNTPWNDFEERRLQHRAETGAADQSQQFSKQTTHQTHERSHNEQHDFSRNYYGGHHRRERHSGGAEGGRGGYAYEEWHDGDGTVAPYYRPEHTSTLRGASSSKHQHQHQQHSAASAAAAAQQQQYAAGGASSYSHHRHHRSGAASGGSAWGRSAGGGAGHRYGHSQSWYQAGDGRGGYYKDGWYKDGTYKERKYRKFYCCCFPCTWPPFGYEEAPPPRPLYYSKQQHPPPL